MTVDVWFGFVLLALGFLITPGISHILMLSNSLAYGARRSLATAAGDLSANTLQMLAAGLGMAALITSAPQAFTAIKWGGVTYLVYLGVRLLFKTKFAPDVEAADISGAALYRQGFFTSASNPKAIVFFAALFPQFISAELPFWPQLIILSLTYLALDGAFLLAYGLGADTLKARLNSAALRMINPLSGIFIIGAAVLLAMKTLPT
ncbi:MAG: LysE family translocator [Maricaulaceae bacterium]